VCINKGENKIWNQENPFIDDDDDDDDDDVGESWSTI
jgi:hypothetical protein